LAAISQKNRMMAYLKIIRPVNLLIIILTQVLFRFFIVETYFKLSPVNSGFNYPEFLILVLSTLFIAAGGYVINDLFDSKTDEVNKPEKVIAGVGISRKALKFYYAGLTIAGIVPGIILSLRVEFISLGFIFPAVAIMLWLYSSEYQKTVLLGNLMIAFMSGLVVLLCGFLNFLLCGHSPCSMQKPPKL
jgi:4-hydroxybenzoate polyprenyltransferase